METKNLAKVFKALSNEQRLKLFKMIYHWEQTMGGICGVDKPFSMACKCFKLSKSTISHHFKELQNAGLITCTRNGQSQCCEINKELINEIKSFLE